MQELRRIDKFKKNTKGITLVALVVTIISLLILAGVSVTTVLNSEGLLYRVSQSANKSKIAQIQEELELLKTLVMPGTLDDYMKTLLSQKEKYRIGENDEENGIYNYEQIDEEHWNVVIEGTYQFLIYTERDMGTGAKVSSRSGIGKSTSGNIIIKFQGQVNTGLLELSEKKGDIKYPNTRKVTVTKNTSKGKLSVGSEDESIATASIEGNVITITPKVTLEEKKRVKIIVMSEPHGEYEAQIVKYNATVLKGSITIEATGYTGEFDGQKHPALTNVKIVPEDAKVTYSLNGGAESTEIPEVEMTGEYSVSITAEKEGYDSLIVTKTVTISKQQNKPENIQLSETSGTVKYPEPKIVTVINNASDGALSVSSGDESIATASISGNTITITPQAILEDGQEVTITVKAEATENYEEQTATYKATVIQGSIELEASTDSYTYDGQPHPAVKIERVDPADATLTYSVNGGEESTEIPQITNADTYTITIKAEKAGYAIKEISKTVTINKQGNNIGETNPNLVLSSARGTITYPNNEIIRVLENKSGGELSVESSNRSALTASISGTAITLVPQIMTSTNTVTITVKSKATRNYEEQTATYIATVKQGTITISATAYNGTYNKTAHNVLNSVSVTPNDSTVTYSLNNGSYTSTMPTITNAGTYNVKIKAEKPGYILKETPVTATIAKAAQNLSVNKTTVTLEEGQTTDIDFVPSSGYGPAAVQYPTGATYSTTVYSWYVRVTGVTPSSSSTTSDWFMIYAQATENYLESNKIKITVNFQQSGPPWTIEQAKAVVKRDGLKSHLGEEVLYYPSAGGTWRIYYYDTEGYFGTRNTLYIKRDQYVGGQYRMLEQTSYPSAALTMMKRMNPKWRDSSYSSIDTKAERGIVGNYDATDKSQYIASSASFIGMSPSAEMFAKSYNVWKTNNPNGGVMSLYIKNQYGYAFSSSPDVIESGPYNLYILPNATASWLASPYCAGSSGYGTTSFVLWGPPDNSLGNKGVEGLNVSWEPLVSVGTT